MKDLFGGVQPIYLAAISPTFISMACGRVYRVLMHQYPGDDPIRCIIPLHLSILVQLVLPLSGITQGKSNESIVSLPFQVVAADLAY